MQASPRLLVLLVVAAAGGCGGSKGPVATYPVSGQVLYGGKPAAKVQVYFFPISAPTVPQIPANLPGHLVLAAGNVPGGGSRRRPPPGLVQRGPLEAEGAGEPRGEHPQAVPPAG